MCERKPSEVADTLARGGPVVDHIRVRRDKRSTKRMLQASRGLVWAPERGSIGDVKVSGFLHKPWGRTEVRKRALAGRQ